MILTGLSYPSLLLTTLSIIPNAAVSSTLDLTQHHNMIPWANSTSAFIVEAGSTFSVTCASSGPAIVRWNSSTAAAFKRRQRPPEEPPNVSCEEFLRSDEVFCSRLLIRNASNLHVGEYTCADGKHSLDGRRNGPRSSSSSVYVFVDDPDELRVELDYFSYLPIHEYDEFVLPCRPSHPDVSVALLKKNGTDFVAVDEKEFSFEPQIGFFKEEARANDSTDYSCVFTRGNVTEENNMKVVVAPARRKDIIPNTPEIEAVIHGYHIPLLGEHTVIVGTDVDLVCNVLLESEGHRLKLSWTKDGEEQRSNFEGRRLSSSDSTRKYVSSKINLFNVSNEDEGNYNCTVTNHMGQANSRVVKLTTTERLCSLKHEMISGSACLPVQTLRMDSSGSGDVTFTLKLLYPPGDEPEIMWRTPDGSVHSSLYNRIGEEKYAFSYKNKYLASFNIRDVNIADSGNYSFYCDDLELNQEEEEEESEGRINFCLDVITKPQSEVTLTDAGDRRFFPHVSAGNEYNVTCLVNTSNPENAVIEWINCDVEDRNCIRQRDDEPSRPKNGRHFQLESVRNYVFETSRKISCEVCDTRLNDCGASRVFLARPLDYYPPKNKVFGICQKLTYDGRCSEIADFDSLSFVERFEGENLTLVCSAAAAENDQESYAIYAEIEGDFSRSQSRYSKQEILFYDRLTLNHSQFISCQGKTANLTVKSATKPADKVPFNMDGSELWSDVGNPVTLDCSMSGIPQPRFKWYKDGVRLKSDSKLLGFSFLQNDSVLHLDVYNESVAGQYECQAANLAGTFQGSREVKVGPWWRRGVLVQTLASLILLAAVATICLFCLMLYCIKRHRLAQDELSASDIARFLHGDPGSLNPTLPLEDQVTLLPYDEDIEFPRERIRLGRQIGSGAFGRVLKAEAVGIRAYEPITTVAVKMPKSPVTKAQLVGMMSEIKIMLHLGKHLNVVNLLGACTIDLAQRELLVLVEYCCHGNLQQFLLNRRSNFINQVNMLTGLYDPRIGCIPEEAPLNYATLDIHSDAWNPNNRSAAAKKASVMSTDSMYEAQLVDTDMTTLNPRGSNYKRVHTVSIGDDDVGEEVRPKQKMSILSTPDQMTTETTLLTNNSSSNGRSFSDLTPAAAAANTGRSSPDRCAERKDYIATKDLLSWAYQVAKGMEHLTNKKVVHGDLAARNILLAENNVVKICDFGLAKDVYANPVYHKTSNGPLPIKWMALESLTYRIFTNQSDVWSYGIVLWELFSLARTPYPDLDPDESFHRKLEAGYRMEKPPYAPEEMYKVMKHCWLPEPGTRPTFSMLADKLAEMLSEGEEENYLRLNRPYEEENEAKQRKYVYLSSPVGGTPSFSRNNNKDSSVPLDEEAGIEMRPMLSNSMRNDSIEEEDEHDGDEGETGTNHKDNDNANCVSNPSYMMQVALPVVGQAHSNHNNRNNSNNIRHCHVMKRTRKPSSRSLLSYKSEIAPIGSIEDDDAKCHQALSEADLQHCLKCPHNRQARFNHHHQQQHHQQQQQQHQHQPRASVSSVSSGFHSVSGDIQSRSGSAGQQNRPASLRRKPQAVLRKEPTPPPSYDAAVFN